MALLDRAASPCRVRRSPSGGPGRPAPARSCRPGCSLALTPQGGRGVPGGKGRRGGGGPGQAELCRGAAEERDSGNRKDPGFGLTLAARPHSLAPSDPHAAGGQVPQPDPAARPLPAGLLLPRAQSLRPADPLPARFLLLLPLGPLLNLGGPAEEGELRVMAAPGSGPQAAPAPAIPVPAGSAPGTSSWDPEAQLSIAWQGTVVVTWTPVPLVYSQAAQGR